MIDITTEHKGNIWTMTYWKILDNGTRRPISRFMTTPTGRTVTDYKYNAKGKCKRSIVSLT